MKKFICLILGTLIGFTLTTASEPYSKDLEKRAKNGDAEAMVALGDAYFEGNGVTKDAKKAKGWYEKAIKADNFEAYEKMAALYTTWDGIEKNPKKAAEWLCKGAEAGAPILAYNVGLSYFNGTDGFGQSYDKAQTFFRKAAQKGHKGASYRLAYTDVLSFEEKDYFEAIELVDHPITVAGADFGEPSAEDIAYGRDARQMARAALGSGINFNELTGDYAKFYVAALLLGRLAPYTGGMLSSRYGNLEYTNQRHDQAEKDMDSFIKEQAASLTGTPYEMCLNGIKYLYVAKTELAGKYFLNAFEKGLTEAGALAYLITKPTIIKYNIEMPFVSESPIVNSAKKHFVPNQYNSGKGSITHATKNAIIEKCRNSNILEYVANIVKAYQPNPYRVQMSKIGNLDCIYERVVDTNKKNSLGATSSQKPQEVTVEELIENEGLYVQLAKRGSLPHMVRMYRRANNLKDAGQAELWMNRLNFMCPYNLPPACRFLYDNIYKPMGESGPMLLIDQISAENPEYVLNWMDSKDANNISKSDKLMYLRQAASVANQSTRSKISTYIKEKFGERL